MSSQFNAAVDYFGLEAATTIQSSGLTGLKVVSSSENRTKQATSGPNSYGDAAVVDAYGETAAPSAEYVCCATVTDDTLPHLGSLHTTVTGGKTALGSITIRTQNGSAPTVSVSGQLLPITVAQLRHYDLPNFRLLARHRAQDFIGSRVQGETGLCTISGSETEDYGLESVEVNFPIVFTLAQPKGVVAAYDLHGDMATARYVMNWYKSTAPTITLKAAATAMGAIMSEPETKSCPENGYTQYTWTVSWPMIGAEGSGTTTTQSTPSPSGDGEGA